VLAAPPSSHLVNCVCRSRVTVWIASVSPPRVCLTWLIRGAGVLGVVAWRCFISRRARVFFHDMAFPAGLYFARLLLESGHRTCVAELRLFYVLPEAAPRSGLPWFYAGQHPGMREQAAFGVALFL